MVYLLKMVDFPWRTVSHNQRVIVARSRFGEPDQRLVARFGKLLLWFKMLYY